MFLSSFSVISGDVLFLLKCLLRKVSLTLYVPGPGTFLPFKFGNSHFFDRAPKGTFVFFELFELKVLLLFNMKLSFFSFIESNFSLSELHSSNSSFFGNP